MKRLFTDDQALSAIRNKKNRSVSAVLRELGATATSGSSHTLIRKIAANAGVRTDHWLGQRWASGIPINTCSDAQFFKVRPAKRTGSYLLKRLLSSGRKKRACENCMLAEWLGLQIPLEVHHVNGNRLDDRIENLQVLCCNCHALTPNYGYRNVIKA